MYTEVEYNFYNLVKNSGHFLAYINLVGCIHLVD